MSLGKRGNNVPRTKCHKLGPAGGTDSKLSRWKYPALCNTDSIQFESASMDYISVAVYRNHFSNSERY